MTAFRYLELRSLLLAAVILSGPLVLSTPIPAAAQLGVVISVQIAPPILPIYVQPPLPQIGYIWTPGYWRWDPAVGYFWVPGTWVLPPTIGVLWTPPYWGWSNGLYVFHAGYWGPHVGFYGGVNYGFGYGGIGFGGGRWEGNSFSYNRTVNNFGAVHVTNIYRENVTVINTTHVSYVGGAGGIKAEPAPSEIAAEHENHMPVTPEQSRHIEAAASNPGLALNHNNGHPTIAATPRPAQFAGVVRPQAAVEHPAVAHPVAAHPLQPAVARPAQPQAPRPVATGAPATRPAEPRPVPQAEARPAAPHPVVARAPAPRPAPAHEERPPEK